ncbi:MULTISPECIES: alpha-hydroxy acid oxidase [unclassified Streptomyces]|uniref:alpha-hydroxy acid oxidase n=1 Tax=unclassified Streptomyces TaxID=2593676 RepID=UPI001BE5AC86|nr:MULTISPECIES: alpha-hydroxy acid oxidase [unclassified Streptomyces]MBT2408576.1 alpha-hydroxy-acid oxidizing protein [Streptomyces sp. ISL-21]MBT2458193.1 alpha-hydroxy-acid oxidizing protein [Streptomyces sp. ISL-86]MBT2608740.1 alpha-hydroxy-acid oxidizing protein [Streptomyces sp. ISL-87]
MADVVELAHRQLPSDVWDFVVGGAGQELTLAANRAALDAVRVVPRALRDVSACAISTTLFGRTTSAPIAIAPVAYHQLVHPHGELATARAARACGVPLAISTLSSHSIEAIAAQGAPVWFQLYWLRDERTRDELVSRAEAAKCDALVVTVDVPWMGRRLRDIRNNFAVGPDVVAANLPDTVRPPLGSTVAAHTADLLSPSLTWADIEALRARTSLPLVLKGILSPEDARRAVDCGVDGIVVSNHGGRQLDGAVGSIECLAAVRAAVGQRCTVLLDGGVRSGVDVLKALALGADAVLVGRPVIWGLAAGGEAGVHHTLELLKRELRDALGLAGCVRVAQARDLQTMPPTIRATLSEVGGCGG